MRFRWLWATGRWIVVCLLFAGGLGLLITLGVDFAQDTDLDRHGDVREATVLDTAPGGDDGWYLLSFTMTNQPVSVWSAEVGRHQVGDHVQLIVDERNYEHFVSKDRFGHRWMAYPVALVFGVIFTGLGIMFVRLDAEGFQAICYLRVLSFPPEWSRPATPARPTAARPRTRSVRRRRRRQ